MQVIFSFQPAGGQEVGLPCSVEYPDTSKSCHVSFKAHPHTWNCLTGRFDKSFVWVGTVHRYEHLKPLTPQIAHFFIKAGSQTLHPRKGFCLDVVTYCVGSWSTMVLRPLRSSFSELETTTPGRSLVVQNTRLSRESGGFITSRRDVFVWSPS